MPTHRPSPLQNRVLPTGEIVADRARGMFTGNRGILPFTHGRLGTSRWKHHHWIICALTHPKGRYHGPMPARGWTPLFFLDEAVGLAAGHRPCAYCRPEAYRAFKAAWETATGCAANHNKIDKVLHRDRVTRTRTQIRHRAALPTLPNGSFIIHDDTPHLVGDDHLFPFRSTGYGAQIRRPSGDVIVLTPAPLIKVLRTGFAPILHETA
ncbi:hypothetical protein MUY35_16410 [Aliiroseovarius sp. S1339]|uniref:hypothetical protein n=1 Tax=Aliiroseovarius sp. S1339 TaxID=2936990 RepID=UPI0020C17B0E|nr:hypothetical protein [Aliiroseovarius sp. S1339]MCK8465444.1 hypothetical protein [Aliiroseovarius sp. S1339]